MLNVIKYIIALLFVLVGGSLAIFKTKFAGGMSVQDWITSGLLVFGGAGYILYSLPEKILHLVRNISLPAFNAKSSSSLSQDREALDYLMRVGIEHNNKLIIDSVVKMNDETFRLRHS